MSDVTNSTITFEDRRELINRAVRDMTPMVANETHAWNLWNYLATSASFKAALDAMSMPLDTESQEAKRD